MELEVLFVISIEVSLGSTGEDALLLSWALRPTLTVPDIPVLDGVLGNVAL